MDVRSYIRTFQKRWATIVVATIIGIVSAAGFVKSSAKMYTASAQIFVAASQATGTAALASGNVFAQSRVQSYANVVSGPAITDAVVRELHLPITSKQLASKISADAPTGKVLLNIHVVDKSPVQAATITNAVAVQIKSYIEKIEAINATGSETEQSPVLLTVIHPAQVPSLPTSPDSNLDILIGLLGGMIVGVGIVSLRESLDTRVRTVTDLGTISSSPVLAVIPQDKKAGASPVAFQSDGQGQRAEAFRQLRTNLQYIDVDSPPKLIALTSAISGEGKSSTAVNLAAAMAEAGLKVCLVDADLRRPSVAKYLKLTPGAGLTSILAGKATFGDVLQSVGHNLAVITSGPIPPNPSALLASTQFRTVLADLAAQTDYVIIDSAPLLPVADGAEVASAADVTLLVAQARRTNRDQLKQGIEVLTRVDAHLGGIIFNQVSNRDTGTYYEYYATEGPTRRAAKK